MRVFLRMNGAPGGCMAKFPETFEELLQIANAKLVAKPSEDGQLSRVFIASGDEISVEEFTCIENGDVLYFSRGEDWIEPPVKEAVPDDKVDAEATPQQSAATVPIAPVKSQTGRPIKARGQLPPGWTAMEFTSSTGKPYRRYVGPSGAKLQSVAEAWRAHNARSTGQLTMALVGQGKADASTKSTPTMKTVHVDLTDVPSVQALDAGLIESRPAYEDQIGLKRDVPSDGAKEEEGEEEEDVFEVEAIIGKRLAQADPADTTDSASAEQSMSCDEVEYLVIWSGYPKEDNSWTPASDILDQALIEDFERRVAKREAMSVEEQREYLINMGLSLDGCDDVVTLRGRVAEAEAAALQTRSLSKAPSNPVKLASGQDSKRQKLDGADKRAGGVEKKNAKMQAREAERQQKATEKMEREEMRALERALDKARRDAEKQLKEAEREADKKRKEEEKQVKASEKEEERLRKEEDRQRKEEERQRKEEERKIKAQEKETERERREKEREAELAKVEAVKKRQSITNFFGSKTQATNPSTLSNSERLASNKAVESGSLGEGCEFEHSENSNGGVIISLTASPVKRVTGETEESGKQIYLRGGKRVVPFYIPEHTRLAPRPYGRKPKGPAARRFLAEWSEFLRQRAEGGHEVKPPRMPMEMQLRCRRQMRARKIELPAWQWAPMKTLSFHEDVRPAYLGTFSRPSISTTSAPAPTSPCAFGFGFNSDIKNTAPLDTEVQELKASAYPVCGNGHVSRRRPFGRDTSLFDYELDSEAEWEPEVEDGEDLGSDLDGEEKDDDDAMSEDEQDDWLVKDGESDPAEEQPGSSSRASRGSLKPMLLLGPLLSGRPENEESSESQLLMEFSVQLFEGLPMRPHAKPDDARLAATLSGSGGAPIEGLLMTPSTKAHPKVGKPTQCVAPRDLPRLATLVHGNAAGIAKLIDAFLESTPADIPKASRMQVEKEIRSMASRESILGGKVCWRVRAELVEELGISTPAHHDANLRAVEDLKKSQQEVKVTSHPTKVLNPAMRGFLKPALSTGDNGLAAFGSCSNHVSRDQGDDGEGTVKMLFQGETA